MIKKYPPALVKIVIAAIVVICTIISFKSFEASKLMSDRSYNAIAQTGISTTFLRWELTDTYTANSFNALTQPQKQAALLDAINAQYGTNRSRETAQVLATTTVPNFGEKLAVNTEMPESFFTNKAAVTATILLFILLGCTLTWQIAWTDCLQKTPKRI